MQLELKRTERAGPTMECPECEARTTNVQGIMTCVGCGWFEPW